MELMKAGFGSFKAPVTDVAYPIKTIGRLYRNRADCENAFDELETQSWMSGNTTHDINRCQTTAGTCTPVCNWWSWYCRAALQHVRATAEQFMAADPRAVLMRCESDKIAPHTACSSPEPASGRRGD
jgi:hypothetical protein